MGGEWRWVVKRRIGGRELFVVAAGKGIGRVEARRKLRDAEGEAWNLAVALTLEERLGEGRVGVEVTVSVYEGRVGGKLLCQTPPVDVVGAARCVGGPSLILLEVKWWRSWKSVPLQAEHAGAREKRQESYRAIERLSTCLDTAPSQLKQYGIHEYLLAIIGDEQFKGVRDPREYIASLTGYPKGRVYLVIGARGPSQARNTVRKVLEELVKKAACERL